MKLRIFVGAVLLLSAFQEPTQGATISTFTDRSSWEAAVTGFPLIKDSFDNEIKSAISITFDSGVVSTNSQAGFNGFPGFRDINNRVSIFKQYENCVQNAATVCSEKWSWKFPLPVIGFGADFSLADVGRLTIGGDFGAGEETIRVAETIDPTAPINAGVSGFLGITAPLPFDTVTFFSRDGNDFINIDNLAFAVSVSESSSTNGLLAFGVFGAVSVFYKLVTRKLLSGVK